MRESSPFERYVRCRLVAVEPAFECGLSFQITKPRIYSLRRERSAEEVLPNFALRKAAFGNVRSAFSDHGYEDRIRARIYSKAESGRICNWLETPYIRLSPVGLLASRACLVNHPTILYGSPRHFSKSRAQAGSVGGGVGCLRSSTSAAVHSRKRL